MIKHYLLILMNGIIANNYVLVQFLGICPFLGVSKKVNQAAGMGTAVILVMLISNLITWPIQTFILTPLGIGYFQTVTFILVIASLVQLLEIITKQLFPALFKSLGVYLPLITTNCAVLGLSINNISSGYTFTETIVSSIGVGIGFLLAIVIFAGVRSKVSLSEGNGTFGKMPLALISASIVSLAFWGLNGIAENLLA